MGGPRTVHLSKLPPLAPCSCGGIRVYCFGPGAQTCILQCLQCLTVTQPGPGEDPWQGVTEEERRRGQT